MNENHNWYDKQYEHYRVADQKDIDEWIEERYNCKISRLNAFTVNIYFNHDKDITFFLLKHS